MTSQNGRAFVLKIGNGGTPEVFTTLAAARAVSMEISNTPVDATATDSAGIEALNGAAGTQAMAITLQGLFKDAAAEETLRAAAFGRTANNYKLQFPNGDVYAASFVISAYSRAGAYSDLESFTATLRRSGAGTFTPGA